MDAAKMRAAGKLSPMEVKQEIARRYEDGTYRPPSRAGISYMIAPLMRTYPNPDLRNHDVVTMNMPHYMFYATHVTDNDIGGGQFNSLNPFVLNAGGQDYIIMLVGDAETGKDQSGLAAAHKGFVCVPLFVVQTRSPSSLIMNRSLGGQKNFMEFDLGDMTCGWHRRATVLFPNGNERQTVGGLPPFRIG